MCELGGGACCHHRDDPIVRTIDQIMQIAGRGVTSGFGAIALQSNGEILVAGSSAVTRFSQGLFGVARLDSNGEFDTTFGSGGTLTTSFAGATRGRRSVGTDRWKDRAVGGMIDPQNRNIDDLAMAPYFGN
jgi:hypothetical protein